MTTRTQRLPDAGVSIWLEALSTTPRPADRDLRAVHRGRPGRRHPQAGLAHPARGGRGAAGGTGGEVYDVATRTRIGDPITAAAPFVYPGFLRPDGKAAAVIVRDGVAVWDLDPERLADASM